jgi:hypothetical protein
MDFIRAGNMRKGLENVECYLTHSITHHASRITHHASRITPRRALEINLISVVGDA